MREALWQFGGSLPEADLHLLKWSGTGVGMGQPSSSSLCMAWHRRVLIRSGDTLGVLNPKRLSGTSDKKWGGGDLADPHAIQRNQ